MLRRHKVLGTLRGRLSQRSTSIVPEEIARSAAPEAFWAHVSSRLATHIRLHSEGGQNKRDTMAFASNGTNFVAIAGTTFMDYHRGLDLGSRQKGVSAKTLIQIWTSDAHTYSQPQTEAEVNVEIQYLVNIPPTLASIVSKSCPPCVRMPNCSWRWSRFTNVS